jgi:ABC-type dipeptide/oligopeptide/nickel transport system permease subunit
VKRFWHVVLWPATAIVVLCVIVNFISTFVHSLAQELAEHAEDRLRNRSAVKRATR